MNECIYTPCLRCSPRCLPIDTPEAHKEHAQIVEEIRSKTPRTDAIRVFYSDGFNQGVLDAASLWELAESLELELAEIQAYAERFRYALHGLIGLVQILCLRPDMTREMREIILDNHRWREALAALPYKVKDEL